MGNISVFSVSISWNFCPKSSRFIYRCSDSTVFLRQYSGHFPHFLFVMYHFGNLSAVTFNMKPARVFTRAEALELLTQMTTNLLFLSIYCVVHRHVRAMITL